MKKIAYIAILAASALAGCSRSPEIWQPEAAPLCGRWLCTVSSQGEVIETSANVLTTSTSANSSEIFVQYGGQSFRCQGDIVGLSFEGSGVEVGRIYKDAVMVKPLELNGDPIAADSIAFALSLGGGPALQFAGHRFTGWETYIQ